jgi:hypothetical protein
VNGHCGSEQLSHQFFQAGRRDFLFVNLSDYLGKMYGNGPGRFSTALEKTPSPNAAKAPDQYSEDSARTSNFLLSWEH